MSVREMIFAVMKMTTKGCYKGLAGYLLVALTGQRLGAADGPLPLHLAVAEDLVRRIDVANTDYRHGAYDVSWETPPHCYTDCSGFLDALMVKVYGFKRDDFQKWVRSKRPNAAAYYETIQASRGFSPVKKISELRAGDIMAVYYRHRTDNSGHILIADGLPESMAPKKPLVEGTQQWLLAVIDCSESSHGPQDTRHKKGADGKDHPGLGRGYLRLYTDKAGEVEGFCWSTLTVSSFKGSDEEPIIIGRFDTNFHP